MAGGTAAATLGFSPLFVGDASATLIPGPGGVPPGGFSPLFVGDASATGALVLDPCTGYGFQSPLRRGCFCNADCLEGLDYRIEVSVPSSSGMLLQRAPGPRLPLVH